MQWWWRAWPGVSASSSVRPAAQPVAVPGRPALPRAFYLDEQGRLYADTDIGPGIVHTLDMGIAVQAVEAGAWVPSDLAFAELQQRHGYVLKPEPGPAGEA